MPIYRTKGTLTGTIEAENVAKAQDYLTSDPMHKYLDPPLKGIVVFLEWRLSGNGHDYTVTAATTRTLTEDELKQLSQEVSGQNSDGLGECFEQQEFAEIAGDPNCGCPWYIDCGCGEYEYGGMISFDWETNELPWERIA